MTKQEIIARVKELGLPENSYIVFGSCPLAVAGIREASDIDLLVSKELHQELQHKGWRQVQKGTDDAPLVYDVFEAHDSWSFSPYNPALADLLQRATEIDGVVFASLDDVRKWKAASGGPKHLKDVRLIEQYLANQNS